LNIKSLKGKWEIDKDKRSNKFISHFYLGKPTLYRENVCCLDYSVAKDGELVAYSWDEEEQLSNLN